MGASKSDPRLDYKKSSEELIANMTDSNQFAVSCAQFTFSPAGSTKLQLGSPKLQRIGLKCSTTAVHGSPASSTCTFSTQGSSKFLVSRGARRAARASPFASISASLPCFASATVSKGKSSPAPVAVPHKKKTIGEILEVAGKKALAGGIPGMVAMAVQVLSLMWLRTTMNYQYRYGTSTLEALRTLYSQGGIPRFYQGLAPALIQGPLSRFGDTAANTGMLALLEDVDLPAAVKTLAASVGAGLFRILLMPVDALKTIMQVEGKNGVAALVNKMKVGGPLVLYDGALAASLATFVGHYPWFATYNTLNEMLPKYDDLPKRLLRSAFMGWCSSLVSDVCSNSIRVIKTSKQASTVPITYPAIVKEIIAKEGIQGLFFRGLGTKLISNGIQGIMFSVLWRLGQDYIAKQDKDKADASKAAEDAAKKGSKK